MAESAHRTAANPLRWFPEYLTLSRRRLWSQSRLLGSALLVGVVAGLGAVVFAVACQLVVAGSLDAYAGYRAHGPAGEAVVGWLHESVTPFTPWMLIVVPAVGGLISGWLVFTFAPEAEGHGTDAVIDAYHRKQGVIRPRVPLIKIVASALTIGSGGSGGREGPIAQIGAGFGSFLAGVLRMRPAERRVLMAAGMGAGIAAIFRAPLAGALFASEVLYRSPEFEPEVIMPAALASVVSYCTFGLFFGWQPLFGKLDPRFDGPIELIGYAALIPVCVILAMLYTRSFYGLTAAFHHLSVPRKLRPMIGAALTGLVGLTLYYGLRRHVEVGQERDVLAVMSFGYGILQKAFTNPAGMAAVLIAVSLGKILTTGLTIGSGGSGGVFGPSMVIGGCAGGAVGLGLHALWPPLAPQPEAFAIVGMAGFFAAAAKTPFSTLVIVSEMTGDYNLILPALFVCTLSFLLSDEQSLYQAQVESRSRSPAHQGTYIRDVLAGVRVDRFLNGEWLGPRLRPGDPLAAVAEHFQDPAMPVLPVVDDAGRLVGVISPEEVSVALQSSAVGSLLVAADMARGGVSPLKPDDDLDRALELFVENDLLALPVVDGERKVVGVVRRADVVGEYLKRVHAPVDRIAPGSSAAAEK
jgi:CIC family chloride channel protein